MKEITKPPVWLGALPIIALIALWSWLVYSGAAPRALLPSPLDVLGRLFELALQRDFWDHVGATLLRLLSGFSLGLVAGILLAIFSVASAAGQLVTNAFVRILAPLPKIAFYQVIIIILGFGHSSKIALVAIEAGFPAYLATYQGLRNVDVKLVWAARSAGASALQVLFGVILPAAAPSVLTGARVAMVISCIVVFLSEMMSSTEGLGYMLIDAARNFRTVDMFVPIVLISALGLSLGAIFTWIRARLLKGFPQN